MSDAFERMLEQRFADTPPAPDAEAFAHRVGVELERQWRFRRWLIGAAGVAGGLIGAGQLLAAGAVPWLLHATATSAQGMGALVREAVDLGGITTSPPHGVVVWVVAALAAGALGAGLTRVIEEI